MCTKKRTEVDIFEFFTKKIIFFIVLFRLRRKIFTFFRDKVAQWAKWVLTKRLSFDKI